MADFTKDDEALDAIMFMSTWLDQPSKLNYQGVTGLSLGETLAHWAIAEVLN